MCFFHRKPRPSSSSSTPSTSSSAVATKPRPSSAAATHGYEWDSEEVRMLFANLNIRDQMLESQHRTPSPPLSTFLQVPAIVPSNPDFPSPLNFPVPPNSPPPPNFPSHPNFPPHPIFPEVNVPSPPNIPSHPNFPLPPNFLSYPNLQTPLNGNFNSSTTPLLDPPHKSFPEHHGLNPMTFNAHGDINSRNFPKYHGPKLMALSFNDPHNNINSFNVPNLTTQNSHNNSVTYLNGSSSDQDGDEHLGPDPPLPTEPVPREARMDLNLNLDASFSRPFSNQVSITPPYQKKTSLTKYPAAPPFFSNLAPSVDRSSTTTGIAARRWDAHGRTIDRPRSRGSA